MPASNTGQPEIVRSLLASAEPSIRWKTRVNVLGESRDTPAIRDLETEIEQSTRVRALLSRRAADGRIDIRNPAAAKWQGAQWVLLTLADIGYPRARPALRPLVDQIARHWLSSRYYTEIQIDRKQDAYKNQDAIPVMQGRVRVCASYQANVAYTMMRLDLEDDRLHDLVERLLHWQWPDGGWNCDKDPDAHTSTFIHTLHAMRALALYARSVKHAQARDARAASERAAEFFLKRKLFRRERDGRTIREEFTKLHYPLYWHYDILFALRVFSEMGMIHDPRCGDAIELLRSKQLPDGGWPAEAKYYKASDTIALGNDYVDWGGTGRTRSNPWVTVDALRVLTG